MRIIIEDTEQKVLSTAATAAIGSTYTPALSAAALGQASYTAGATDAGGPPQELLQSLLSAPGFNNQTFSGNVSDAGAAPTD